MRTALGLLAVALVATGCDVGDLNETTGKSDLDCSPTDSLEIGAANRAVIKQFQTSGGNLKVELVGIDAGIFNGFVDSQQVLFGNVKTTLPPIDGKGGSVDYDYDVKVTEKEPAVVNLPMGEYWVVAAIAKVTLSFCGDETTVSVPDDPPN